MKIRSKRSSRRGFALVVALSLMILLTIIAVGLLALSSITLRSAGQGEAMATARNNARLALMLAIGELQKGLGPDKAISANAEILAANPGKPNTMGIWESWNPDSNLKSAGVNPVSLDYDGEKQNRFRSWLVSSPNPVLAASRNFGLQAWSGRTIELVGKNSLSGAATAADSVIAGIVPVKKDTKLLGNFAWHVSDESAKARINTYKDPAQNTNLARKRALAAGHRPNPTVVKGVGNAVLDFLPQDLSPEDFNKAKTSVAKVTSNSQIDLVSTAAGRIKAFRNHVTPYSLGLLTDVRNGGLKKDLTSMFEFTGSLSSTTLPAEFNNKRLYDTTLGLTGASDPFWSVLAGYYNTFRGITTADSNPTYYQRPAEGFSVTTITPPRRFYPGPVIAKVEALFSYVTRDAHAGWVSRLAAFDPQLKYMGHFVYTPLVTLHNPYNVNLSFDNLEVAIQNFPVAMRIVVNGRPQSSRLVCLNDMFVYSQDYSREKSFTLRIANWSSPTGSSTAGPIVMRPGQTMICAPYLDPGASFNNNKGTPFFDWENNLTGQNKDGTIAAVKAKPGYFGPSVGFSVDWVTPTHAGYNLPPAASNDDNMGICGLRATDTFFIEYGLVKPPIGTNNAFLVTAKLTSQGRTFDYGGLNFVYQDQATLDKLFGATLRYPSSGVLTQAMTYANNNDPISSHALAQTIGVFSAYSRTAYGGVYENGTRNPIAGGLNLRLDGKIAGKPYLFHNPARPLVLTNLQKEAPSLHSHELNFQRLFGRPDDFLEVDTTNRTPSIVGNTTSRGIKSGSYLELPTGPMLSIADFRRSNALNSSYLPGFVMPVGNSIVSPLMSTDKVVERDTSIAPYDLLDHSTLANQALYDRFYFSTFATDGTVTPDVTFQRFMDGSKPLPQQNFEPYIPSGRSVKSAKEELFTGTKPKENAYQLAAEYQMVRGPFNVNSTSVQAWKAVLASMKRNKTVTLWARSGQVEERESTDSPVMSMSLSNGGLVGSPGSASNIDNLRTNNWNGYRELTDSELEALATNIVDQVRTRGPFLSLSEFVNRRLGGDSEFTRKGALETAIEKSGINAVGIQAVPIAANDISDTTVYNFKSPKVVEGNPAEGAPGLVTQGDIMKLLEPAATVRSDTFVIRVAGEAVDARGVITAKAYAEAVVQRVPEYIDQTDRPSVNVYTDTAASPINKLFGRRMSIVSFRWLSSNEI